MVRAGLLALVLVAVAAAAPADTERATGAAKGPRLAGCPLFPEGFATNRRVDRLPVHRDSAAIIASTSPQSPLYADYGSASWEGSPMGIPYDVVTRRTQRSRVRFEYAGESDDVAYPIPAGVRIEGGSDRHALLLDRSACRLYELFALRRVPGGWEAGSGAVWNLRRTRLRPAGWTSADAAGLPILPLLALYPEVRRGAIRHALRVTFRRTRRAYVHPARHQAGASDDPSLPRMGERLRLKQSVSLDGLPPQARIIARALKRYGLIVADNGSDWFMSGAPHPGWDQDQLRALGRLRGEDFEVVDTSSLRSRR